MNQPRPILPVATLCRLVEWRLLIRTITYLRLILWTPWDENRLPKVQFRYQVDEETCLQTIQFSDDTVSAPDGVKHCLEKYPLDFQFPVFYQPDQIHNYTLVPGPARDDRLIFIVGIAGFLFALALVVFID